MEQLTTVNNREMMRTSRGRVIEVAMLRKKVEIKLTQSQFEALDRMMVLYLATTCFNGDLLSKANYFTIHQVYEKRIRPKYLDLKTVFKLKFTIAEASALEIMFNSLNIPVESVYEITLVNLICSEIDHQTA